ncbi:zinc-binding dehydrogenase [Psychromonas sp.]
MSSLTLESSKIKPIVAQTFPLEEISRAQDVFLKKKHVGKIVLKTPQ